MSANRTLTSFRSSGIGGSLLVRSNGQPYDRDRAQRLPRRRRADRPAAPSGGGPAAGRTGRLSLPGRPRPGALSRTGVGPAASRWLLLVGPRGPPAPRPDGSADPFDRGGPLFLVARGDVAGTEPARTVD